jgi:hypothetical protein
MKYLVQVRFNGADAVINALPAGEQDKITAEFQAIRELSGVLDGNQLEPPDTAKNVRVNDGQTLISDGPGADDDTAAINGYYVLDAQSLDAAIAFAAGIPVARLGGTVEVRAMMER